MNNRQFSLSSLLAIVSFICAVLALVITASPFVQLVAGSVVAANILGAIAAIVVTHGFGLPNDGSFRQRVDADTTDGPSAEPFSKSRD